MNDKKFHPTNFAKRPLGMRLAMLVRLWRSVIDEAIADTNLTQSRWTVLMQLSVAEQPMTVSELALAQGIELPPLTRTLTQLEELGYIRRESQLHDRRVRLIILTEQGEALLTQVHAEVERCQQKASEGLSPEALEQFNQTVNLLAENMSKLL